MFVLVSEMLGICSETIYINRKFVFSVEKKSEKINKIKFHLFEKTYKKEFSKFIFTIEFKVKIWEHFEKNTPEKIPDKPTV